MVCGLNYTRGFCLRPNPSLSLHGAGPTAPCFGGAAAAPTPPAPGDRGAISVLVRGSYKRQAWAARACRQMHRCFSLLGALPGNGWCFILHPRPQWVFTLRHLRPSELFFPNLGPGEQNQLHLLAVSQQGGCKKGGAAAYPLRLSDHCWMGEEDFAAILLPQPLLHHLALRFKDWMMPRSLSKHDCDPSVEAGKVSGGSFLPSWDSLKPWWVAVELLDIPGDSKLCCI